MATKLLLTLSSWLLSRIIYSAEERFAAGPNKRQFALKEIQHLIRRYLPFDLTTTQLERIMEFAGWTIDQLVEYYNTKGRLPLAAQL